MKRLLFGSMMLAGVLFSLTTMAQKGNIGLNVAVARPLGDNADVYKTGFGGDVSLDYYFNDLVDIGIETGYKSFSYDVEALDDENFNLVPIQLTAALHTDISPTVDLYGELGGGIFIFSSSLEGSESESYGGLSPRLGLAFELRENEWFLDMNACYTHVFTDDPAFNTLGVNIGFLYTIF